MEENKRYATLIHTSAFVGSLVDIGLLAYSLEHLSPWIALVGLNGLLFVGVLRLVCPDDECSRWNFSEAAWFQFSMWLYALLALLWCFVVGIIAYMLGAGMWALGSFASIPVLLVVKAAVPALAILEIRDGDLYYDYPWNLSSGIRKRSYGGYAG